MEFMNRNGRPSQTAGAPVSSQPGAGGNQRSRKRKLFDAFGLGQLILSVGVIAIVAGIAVLLSVGRPASEAASVNKSDMQAVFLNGGQVYFGDIRDLTGNYIRLGNIYYLRVNQQVQPNSKSTSANDISLVKLGCELHGPQDEMLINRQQVIFWENLKTDGQVAKAVAEYVKKNPNGQDCTATATTPKASTTTKSTN